LIVAVNEPNAYLVEHRLQLQDDAGNELGSLELLAEKRKQEIFPELRGGVLLALDLKLTAFLQGSVLPEWLDALLENMKVSAIWHGSRPPEVLLNEPELLDLITMISLTIRYLLNRRSQAPSAHRCRTWLPTSSFDKFAPGS